MYNITKAFVMKQSCPMVSWYCIYGFYHIKYQESIKDGETSNVGYQVRIQYNHLPNSSLLSPKSSQITLLLVIFITRWVSIEYKRWRNWNQVDWCSPNISISNFSDGTNVSSDGLWSVVSWYFICDFCHILSTRRAWKMARVKPKLSYVFLLLVWAFLSHVEHWACIWWPPSRLMFTWYILCHVRFHNREHAIKQLNSKSLQFLVINILPLLNAALLIHYII